MVSGIELNTGIRDFLAAAMIGSDAVETVMSPLIQIASAPRASTEPAASMAPVELSALASINSMPSSEQTLRAMVVWATEFASAGFQTSPTRRSPGHIVRAMRKIDSTGCRQP